MVVVLDWIILVCAVVFTLQHYYHPHLPTPGSERFILGVKENFEKGRICAVPSGKETGQHSDRQGDTHAANKQFERDRNTPCGTQDAKALAIQCLRLSSAHTRSPEKII